MAFNRNKNLSKAQKLLQKGKINDAIKEYQIVVDNDPSDVRTLLKIGDLQAKIGNIEAANDTYRKVGEHYARDGFFLKAVAVFKQILKLDPGLISIYLRLAELYQQLGLNSEAMKQYQVVVRHYENQGLKKESLDVLRKMAELDPGNTASKVKLAELYAKEGHKEAATDQLRSVVEALKAKENYPDLVRVYEKMEALGVSEAGTQLELSEIHLRMAEPKRALAKLQELFQNDPKNPRVLELLARSFSDLQQPEKAKSVYQELVGVLEEKGMLEERDRVSAKLRAFGVTGSTPSAVEGIPKVEADLDELDVLSQESDDIAGKPSEAREADKTAAPEPVAEAAPPPASPDVSPSTDAAGAARLLGEINTFLKYGLVDKACETLSEAVIITPNQPEVRAKLVEAFNLRKDTEGLKGALSASLKTAEKMHLAEAATEIRGELSKFEGVTAAKPSKEPAETPASPSAAAKPKGPRVDVSDDELMDLEIVDDEAPTAAATDEGASSDPALATSVLEKEFEREGVDEEALDLEAADLPEALSEAPASAEKTVFDVVKAQPVSDAFEISLDEVEAAVDGAAVPVEAMDAELEIGEKPAEASAPKIVLEEPEVSEEEFVGEELDVSAEMPEPEAAAEEIELSETKQFRRDEAEEVEDTFAAEMEEAAFFIQEGLLDEAREIYESILSADPAYKVAQEKLAEMKAAEPAKPVSRTLDGKPERRTGARPQREPVEAEPEKAVSKKTQRVLEEKRQQEEPGGLFDLSVELQDEIAELEQELQETKGKDEEEFLSPEEVISEFKKGVARTVARDDYQTHYNLGIAYKEMGLLDEAISEFGVASNGPKVAVDAASMIGLCLMGKRDYVKAIEIYRKTLAQVSPRAQEALGLSYELAEAYIGHGNISEAYKLFARVCDVDPTFRDVRRRARELEADLGSAAPPPTAPEKSRTGDKDEDVVEISDKKNKISYI